MSCSSRTVFLFTLATSGLSSTSAGEIVRADSPSESTSDSRVNSTGPEAEWTTTASWTASCDPKLDRILRPVVVKLADSLSQTKISTSGLGGASDASGIAGKIAKVVGSTLYVNVGSEAGVKEGDEFSVIRAGEVIKDPDTGEVLGANKVKVGRIKVTAIRGPRLSAAISLSGSGYKSGDVLKK